MTDLPTFLLELSERKSGVGAYLLIQSERQVLKDAAYKLQHYERERDALQRYIDKYLPAVCKEAT